MSIIVVVEKCNQISAVARNWKFWPILRVFGWLSAINARHASNILKKMNKLKVIAWSGVMSDTILFKGVGTTELFIQMKCGIFLVFKRLCGD